MNAPIDQGKTTQILQQRQEEIEALHEWSNAMTGFLYQYASLLPRLRRAFEASGLGPEAIQQATSYLPCIADTEATARRFGKYTQTLSSGADDKIARMILIMKTSTGPWLMDELYPEITNLDQLCRSFEDALNQKFEAALPSERPAITAATVSIQRIHSLITQSMNALPVAPVPMPRDKLHSTQPETQMHEPVQVEIDPFIPSVRHADGTPFATFQLAASREKLEDKGPAR